MEAESEDVIMRECIEKLDRWLISMQTERKLSNTATLCKLIRKLPQHMIEIVVQTMTDRITALVSYPCQNVSGVCNVLNACFDNFPFAARAVGLAFDRVCPFIIAHLTLFTEQHSATGASDVNVMIQESVELIHLCSRLLPLVLKLHRAGTCQVPEPSVVYDPPQLDVLYDGWCRTITTAMRSLGFLAIDTKINLATSLWLIHELFIRDIPSLRRLHADFAMSLASNDAKGERTKDDDPYFMDKFVMAAGALYVWSDPIILPEDSEGYLRLFLSLCEDCSSDTQVLLMATRALQVLGKHKCFLSYKKSEQWIRRLMSVTFTVLEHPVPCVRHAARDLLYTLVLLPDLQPAIQRTALAAGIHRKSFFIGIAALGTALDARTIVTSQPDLPAMLIASLTDPTTVSHVSSAVESMSVHDSLATTDLAAWSRVWLMPLLHTLTCCPAVVAADIEKLLLRLFKEHLGSVEHVLQQWKDEASDKYIQGVLACLKIRNKLRGDGANLLHILQDSTASDHDILLRCIEDGEDDVRLSALSLIAEASCPSPQHLHAVVHMLVHNLNNHRPATRQKLLSFFKKLLSRVSILWQSCQRAANKKKKKQNFPTTNEASVDNKLDLPIPQFQEPSNHVTVSPPGKCTSRSEKMPEIPVLRAEHCEDFLTSLIEVCYSNIFAGANFNRLNTILNVLLLCQEVVDEELCQKAKLHDGQRWGALMTALSSSYEENKVLTVSLARGLPFSQLPINEPDTLLQELRESFGLIQQLEPPSVLLGSYRLLILLRVPSCYDVMKKRFCSRVDRPSSVVEVLCIQVLARYVALQLDEARSSLMIAARQAPMYGTMFALRLVLKHLSPEHLHLEPCINVLNSLVEMAFDMADVVSSVVNNSSPEGHLPMDFHRLIDDSNDSDTSQLAERPKAKISDLPSMMAAYKVASSPELKLELSGHIKHQLEAELERKMQHDARQPLLELGNTSWSRSLRQTRQLLSEFDCYHKFFEGHLPKFIEDRSVTAQALLLLSWRTMKEACLYLGDLVTKIPLNTLLNSHILTEATIKEIGLKLRLLLSEIKHRGAFEQADVAFSQLCTALWLCPKVEMCQLPSAWLQEIIDEMMLPSSEQTLKLTSTRRSAGLPFLIQAIVATEVVSTNSSSSRCLRETMEKLFVVAEEINGELEPRLHSYNILRALFKHAQLGEFVAPYISRALRLAIRGSREASWPERNCANMLFASLVSRIFGVSRSKDHLSSKNKMTSRVFFQRFPDLYEVFHEELKSVGVRKGGVTPQPSLYLVLLLMGRLYPPSNQETVGVDLEPFLTKMAQCADHPILRVRVLAARALVPFLPAERITHELRWRLQKLEKAESVSNNARHGLLLQVFELLKEGAKLPWLLERITSLELPLWMLPNRSLSSSVPFPVLHVLMRVLTLVYRHYPNSGVKAALLEPCDWSMFTYWAANREVQADVFLAHWVLLSIEVHSEERLPCFLLSLRHCGVEVVENVALQFIYCLLVEPDQRDSQWDFSLEDGMLDSVPCLSCPKLRLRLKQDLKNSMEWRTYIQAERAMLPRVRNLQQRRLRTVIIGKFIEEEASSRASNPFDILEMLVVYAEAWDVDGVSRPHNTPSQVKAGDMLCDDDYRRLVAAILYLLEKDRQCRLVVANVITHAYILLLPTNNNVHSVEYRLLWLILHRLLADEDDVVRLATQSTIRLLVQTAIERQSLPHTPTRLDDGSVPASSLWDDPRPLVVPKGSVTPLAAQHLLLASYVQLMEEQVTSIKMDLLLLATLSVVETTEEPDQDDPLEIFKRGNPNPFCEPVALTRQIIAAANHYSNPIVENPIQTQQTNFQADDILQYIQIELAPHFARYGLRLKNLYQPEDILQELRRIPTSENAASDLFWTQVCEILCFKMS